MINDLTLFVGENATIWSAVSFESHFVFVKIAHAMQNDKAFAFQME